MKKGLSTATEKFTTAMDLLHEAMNSAVEKDPDCLKIEPETEHYFGGGVYCRVMHVDAGTVLTGKIHRYAGINIMLRGDMTVATESGVKRVQAPSVFVSPPGVRRAGVAHASSTWINLHATNQTDPDQVEREVVVNDYIDLKDAAPDLPPSGLTDIEEAVLLSLMAKAISHKSTSGHLTLLAENYLKIGEK